MEDKTKQLSKEQQERIAKEEAAEREKLEIIAKADETREQNFAFDDLSVDNCLWANSLYLNVVFNLTQIFSFSNCSLLSNSTEKPVHESYADQIAKNGEGKVSTYVPFRNGLMLSAGAALAQSLFPEEKCEIWVGAHADDAAGNAYVYRF